MMFLLYTGYQLIKQIHKNHDKDLCINEDYRGTSHEIVYPKISFDQL